MNQTNLYSKHHTLTIPSCGILIKPEYFLLSLCIAKIETNIDWETRKFLIHKICNLSEDGQYEIRKTLINFVYG